MTEGLEVEKLVVRHRGRALVDIADVAVRPGRPVTIVGESGSGKSLLAHAVMGTLVAELDAQGTVRLAGRRYAAADRAGRRPHWGRELALLPQEPTLALDPTMRVGPQVAGGARARSKREARGQASSLLERLGLGGTERSYPHMLSGGMAQRVSYAAATVGGARMLIVDEPSKGLDRAALDRLVDLLRAHVAGGGVLLCITHDLWLARRLGGDVLVMREAAVVEHGPAETVLSTPQHDYTRRLVRAEPAGWPDRGAAKVPSSDRETHAPLASAHAITKSYGRHTLFEDLSWCIRSGERWSLTGPSGSGKTTLADALLRLTAVDRGRVTHSPTLAGGRAQKLYQDPSSSFPPRVPLGAAMADVARRHGVDTQRVTDLLHRTGLGAELLERRVSQVSGGELQRLAIVRAMLPRPALLVADEPTSRLDLVSQQVTMSALDSELAASGCALVLVTHDPDLASAMTDRRIEMRAHRAEQAVTAGTPA
jgi:peptide/nickel transport system ATP-binding protein